MPDPAPVTTATLALTLLFLRMNDPPRRAPSTVLQHVSRDELGEARDDAAGEIVLHARDGDEPGARDRGGGRLTAARRDQEIAVAVDDERGRGDLPEAARAVSR